MYNKFYSANERTKRFKEAIKKSEARQVYVPISDDDYVQEEAGLFMAYKLFYYYDDFFKCWEFRVVRFMLDPDDTSPCRNSYLFDIQIPGFMNVKKLKSDDLKKAWYQWKRSHAYHLLEQRDIETVDDLLNYYEENDDGHIELDFDEIIQCINNMMNGKEHV